MNVEEGQGFFQTVKTFTQVIKKPHLFSDVRIWHKKKKWFSSILQWGEMEGMAGFDVSWS